MAAFPTPTTRTPAFDFGGPHAAGFDALQQPDEVLLVQP